MSGHHRHTWQVTSDEQQGPGHVVWRVLSHWYSMCFFIWFPLIFSLKTFLSITLLLVLGKDDTTTTGRLQDESTIHRTSWWLGRHAHTHSESSTGDNRWMMSIQGPRHLVWCVLEHWYVLFFVFIEYILTNYFQYYFSFTTRNLSVVENANDRLQQLRRWTAENMGRQRGVGAGISKLLTITFPWGGN
jgi:hypothetical protein